MVGPIGVDVDAVQSSLSAALRKVEYTPHVIHVTKLMTKLEPAPHARAKANVNVLEDKIRRANELRSRYGSNAALAALAI